MLLTVNPIRQAHFSCIDGMIATMANYLGRHFALMFIGYMGFAYIPDQPGANTFGEKLFYGIQRYSRSALHRYHHIKISWRDAENYTSLHNIILHSLHERMPVGVYLDSFCCPWNPSYQKFHINHYVLVIGLDQTDGTYICLDPYASAEQYRLPYGRLREGFREYILFDKEPLEDDQPLTLSAILCENLYSPAGNEHFEKNYRAVLEFAGDLSANIDTQLETKEWNGDLYNTLLFRKINTLGKNRTKFAGALQFLADAFENEDLRQIASAARELHDGWDLVNNLLFRLHMTGRESLKTTIYNKLVSAGENERRLSRKLIETAEKYKGQTKRPGMLQGRDYI